jgi:hypothetical protein
VSFRDYVFSLVSFEDVQESFGHLQSLWALWTCASLIALEPYRGSGLVVSSIEDPFQIL